jgi:histone H3/H4
MADEAEVLVVVSKMKKYIKEKGGLNTSDAVAAVVSERIRAMCDAAIESAKADGRKTVLDRDVPGGAGGSPAPVEQAPPTQ